MALYKVKGGKKIKLTAKEAKATVMRAHGWTAEEYRKKYDIFKNKLRAYEEYKRAKGETVTKQSPAEMLYKQARAMLKEGADYKKSWEFQRIEAFTAVSMGKAGKKLAQSAEYRERVNKRETGYIYRQFEGLIRYYPLAYKMFLDIDDATKLQKALTDFANELHRRGVRDHGGAKSTEAIPYGEVSGSDPQIDFDYTQYI